MGMLHHPPAPEQPFEGLHLSSTSMLLGPAVLVTSLTVVLHIASWLSPRKYADYVIAGLALVCAWPLCQAIWHLLDHVKYAAKAGDWMDLTVRFVIGTSCTALVLYKSRVAHIVVGANRRTSVNIKSHPSEPLAAEEG
ncbi:MAG: hypothetical protein KDB32_09485 [Planctomycetes bacterium]|nr:hypothetical protein [Planctomycetota bacterium]